MMSKYYLNDAGQAIHGIEFFRATEIFRETEKAYMIIKCKRTKWIAKSLIEKVEEQDNE